MVLYEGEQHGFRKTETIRHSQDVSLYFLGKVFGFEPADDVPVIEIANLSCLTGVLWSRTGRPPPGL